MGLKEKMIIIEGLMKLSEHYLNENICYMTGEQELFIQLYDIIQNHIDNNEITDEEFSYIITKFYGSESHYIFSIRSGVDEKEAMLNKVKHNLYDNDCTEITGLKNGKRKYIYKRNAEGNWYKIEIVK